MTLLLGLLALMGSIWIIGYGAVFLYKLWQQKKYGPLQKDIGFESSRFRLLRYLADKGVTVNRINVIEDLEINIPDFKQVVNSLNRDKLIQTGPQSIKITPFGKQYHDVFLTGKENDGS